MNCLHCYPIKKGLLDLLCFIIDRIDELESEIEDLEMDEPLDVDEEKLAELRDELEILQTLIDEIDNISKTT